MRNILKATTLENRFPLLAVEEGCILSKDADITVAFRVELPELYTVTSAEYAAIHSSWVKAIKVLPTYSVVHKQDWFVKEGYRPDLQKEEMSFLSRSFERHFNERPFLNHACYLFLTKTTKNRNRQQSNFSTLCRGHIIAKEVRDRDTARKFLEATEQFERIMNESGFIRLARLTDEEIIGTAETPGLIEKYFSLSLSDTTVLEDIDLKADQMRIGDKRLCLHTLSDTEDLPGLVGTDMRYERLSTDRSDCRLSFAAPVGLLLSCNHIYNQYVLIDDSAENLQRFEKSARNMHSLSRYSRSNQINKQWIDGHNTVDVPTLFWAGIPGNEADFPAEESFYTFIEQAVCLFNEETNYRDSLSPFGIKMADRSGKPIHLDISDLPMKQGIITNRNKFILGPSGSGKSFFTNHLLRQYWEQNTHIVLVDTGNSYQGLCEMIRHKTQGEDGVYFTYSDESPISFNPFYTTDKVYDVEKRESIKTLLLTLWKKDNEPATRSEEVALSNAVSLFIERIKTDDGIVPSFNSFYEYLTTDYSALLREKKVREKDFDLANFLNVLEPYYKGGEYDYLLNSDKQLDLLNARFIVFEIDSIKGAPVKAA